jgi:hypothetical protein
MGHTAIDFDRLSQGDSTIISNLLPSEANCSNKKEYGSMKLSP